MCVVNGWIDGVSGNGGDNVRLLFDKMFKLDFKPEHRITI